MDNSQPENKKESLREKIGRLLKLNNTPHEIALGVGIGAFIAIMPLYGLHTVMVILFALIIPRVNKIAILIGTNVSLPPTVPFITWIGYNIGRFILGDNYPILKEIDFRNFNIRHFMNLYYPLLIGSIIEGITCAIILYLVVFWAIKISRKRRGQP
jgi:uncharacterized protein (DUF2062 family)